VTPPPQANLQSHVVAGTPAPKSATAPPYAVRQAFPEVAALLPDGGASQSFGRGRGWGKGKGWGKGFGKGWFPFPMNFGKGGYGFPMKGWGRGGGWGKGGGGGQGGDSGGRKKAASVEESFVVDEEVRVAGTVDYYSKWKGFGFVTLTQKGLVPEDVLFCHWQSLESDDRFPFLVKGLEVECNIVKWRESFNKTGGSVTLRTKNVTLPGGVRLTMQNELDAQKKEFVGGQDLRYTGNLKFYEPRGGFGYVKLDDGYQVDPEVPTELRIERAEVNAGGRQPSKMEDIAVEFGIWKTARGAYKAYNCTLPGGVPMLRATIENRVEMTGQSFTGEVKIWHWRQGWGFVKLDASCPLPTAAQQKLLQQTEAAVAKAAERGRPKEAAAEELVYFRRGDVSLGQRVRQDCKVSFTLYTDDKGVGATSLSVTEDAPEPATPA